MAATWGCHAHGRPVRSPLFGRFQRPHLIGIGGIGMEGLARLLAQSGCRVSGSDRAPSRALQGLGDDGFTVYAGHRAEQLADADLVVFSAAVPLDNVELQEARRRGLPAVRRAELLGELSREPYTVAIAGSHGKTTTSSMVAAILRRDNRAPSVLVGGSRDGRAEAELGAGAQLVVEADEFDRSFLWLHPDLAVVTSVDAEHLDCYGDLAGVETAFCQFLARVPFYGTCLVAGDGRVGPGVARPLQRPCLRWGMEEGNDYRATAVELTGWGSTCTVVRGDRVLGALRLSVPGEHNLRNAVGAAAAADVLGVDFTVTAAALAAFRGVGRRFESRGEVAGVAVVDDYAHHPAEVAAALAAARATGRRVVAAFQPHLYSRTRDLYGDFARALAGADTVFLLPVYAAREAPIAGVGSELIADAMAAAGTTRPTLLADREQLLAELLRAVRPGDLVLTLGAGNLDEAAGWLVDRLGDAW